jgi:hypothetical protein
MAYKTTISKACANRAAALTELWSKMAAMGWTLVDGNFTAKTIAAADVEVTNNTFTSNAHGMQNGTPCQITTTGTLPGGLSANTQYYIVYVETNTFKLSTTYNGSAIDITSQGSGDHTISESFRVYSSNGEDSDKAVEYIKISWFSATTSIKIRSFYLYAAATKSFSAGSANTEGSLTTSESGFYLWIYGNKNVVQVIARISTTYYRFFWGHLKNFFTLQTALSAGISSGSGVSLSVASTVGFEPGSTYQIIGMSGEGRDNITIQSITDATTMVAATVARSYASGALVGINPSTFGHSTGGTGYYFTCTFAVVGLADATLPYGGAAYGSLLQKGYIDPDIRTGKYVLFPIVITADFKDGTYDSGLGKYMDGFMLDCPSTGMTSEDTLSVTRLGSGTSSGSNTSSTLNDTAKSWTTNAWAGKVLVLSFGVGSGQICKIESNTATEITLATGHEFTTVPDATTQYVICEKAYRYISDGQLLIASQEGV